ncbi:MAG: hypothetical protein E7334_04715 [Clostridiales bacterium]|nr:hypothetical protein [Clostridiales bacterium]
MIKRIFTIILSFALLMSLAACSSQGETAVNSQVPEDTAAVDSVKGDKPATTETTDAPQSTKAADRGEKGSAALAYKENGKRRINAFGYSDSSVGCIIAINALIDGVSEIEAAQAGTYLAQAVLPEGMAVDHWEINGLPAHNDGRKYSLEFEAEGPTFVAAVIRPEKKVTTINAVMQFLNKNGKPAGETFTEFVFEEDYLNPVRDEVFPGGKITVRVKADVPKDYEIDYWKINEVPYHFNYPVSEFTVVDLDETTVYEVVLKPKKEKKTEAGDIMKGPGRTETKPDDVFVPMDDIRDDVEGDIYDDMIEDIYDDMMDDIFGIETEDPQPTDKGVSDPVYTMSPVGSQPSFKTAPPNPPKTAAPTNIPAGDPISPPADEPSSTPGYLDDDDPYNDYLDPNSPDYDPPNTPEDEPGYEPDDGFPDNPVDGQEHNGYEWDEYLEEWVLIVN